MEGSEAEQAPGRGETKPCFAFPAISQFEIMGLFVTILNACLPPYAVRPMPTTTALPTCTPALTQYLAHNKVSVDTYGISASLHYRLITKPASKPHFWEESEAGFESKYVEL